MASHPPGGVRTGAPLGRREGRTPTATWPSATNNPPPSPRGISEQGFPEPDPPPGPSQATSSSKASLAWPSGLSSALGGLSQTHRPASPRPDPRHRALSALDMVPECPGPSGQLSRAFPPSSHNYSNPAATFWAPLVAKASKRKRWDDSGVTWPPETCPCDDIW